MSETAIDAALVGKDPDVRDRVTQARVTHPGSIFTVDAKNRILQIVTLGPAKMLGVIEMAGGKAAENQTWLRMAMMLSSLRSIDGLPVRPVTSKDQFLALADEIGNEGLVAIADATTADAASVPAPDEEESVKATARSM